LRLGPTRSKPQITPARSARGLAVAITVFQFFHETQVSKSLPCLRGALAGLYRTPKWWVLKFTF